MGDSLELCITASQIEDADLVVFCGVDFMAETAAILNPEKKDINTGPPGRMSHGTHAPCRRG